MAFPVCVVCVCVVCVCGVCVCGVCVWYVCGVGVGIDNKDNTNVQTSKCCTHNFLKMSIKQNQNIDYNLSFDPLCHFQ